jgi:type IV secretory pathway VirJ component
VIALFFALALPLIEVPVSTPGDRFAVVVSGDGGWRKIDSAIAERLRIREIPTVGLDTAAYYRTRRTPEESAAALEAIIREYRAKWHRDKVIVIGFSRGADVLPFMINRLPADVRGSIIVIALLGPEPLIDFRFHPWWDIFHRSEPQFPVEPEIARLRGDNVVCVYGLREKDSLCPLLDRGAFTVMAEPGGHHFGGNYGPIVDAILARTKS